MALTLNEGIRQESRKDIAREYARLAKLPTLSESQKDRLGQILGMAEEDQFLSAWIAEVDHAMSHKLGHNNAKSDKDQQARVKEFVLPIDSSTGLSRKDILANTRWNLIQRKVLEERKKSMNDFNIHSKEIEIRVMLDGVCIFQFRSDEREGSMTLREIISDGNLCFSQFLKDKKFVQTPGLIDRWDSKVQIVIAGQGASTTLEPSHQSNAKQFVELISIPFPIQGKPLSEYKFAIVEHPQEMCPTGANNS